MVLVDRDAFGLDGSGFRKYFGWEGLEFVESLGCGKALSWKG